eukprot:TRINITY_DN2104_c0_g1_i2.p1 TRINITY_DN2104_c0_g1~~TRINITY_DN2104_c0_g1_i2.p1  ORF type:complete len:313 (+),score=35.23 TRINITY_DN2104_c0_g1_i2:73-1011(+)
MPMCRTNLVRCALALAVIDKMGVNAEAAGSFLASGLAENITAAANQSIGVLDQGIDLLTIESIQCVRSAGGIDGFARAGMAALGAATAAAATVAGGGTAIIGTGGAAIGMMPLTAGLVAKAAASGAGFGVTALEFLDAAFSGQDDLIVQVDGKTVVPFDGSKFQAMNPGDTIRPNIQRSIKTSGRISLIEYDSGSDNDDLGSVDVLGGADYRVPDAIVYAPRSEDGSIYYVTYRVEANKGLARDLVDYMLCGTNQCIECARVACHNQDYSQLDRDKDKSDLKTCPGGFKHMKYIKYPQHIVADVYLRVCQRI